MLSSITDKDIRRIKWFFSVTARVCLLLFIDLYSGILTSDPVPITLCKRVPLLA